MSHDMYVEYRSFLNKYKLYDKQIFDYILEKSILVNHKKIDEFHSFGCSIVVDQKGKLVEIIPCVPFLKNEKMVAINIFVYVQAMMLIPNIGKTYDERFYNKLFPVVFLELYILSVQNKKLLEFEKKMIFNMFNQDEEQYENAIQYKDFLINSYNKNNNSLDSQARRVRRKAINYLNKKNYIKNIDYIFNIKGFLSYTMIGGFILGFSDNFFKKVEKKTNVDKDTILSLANKLQQGNMKDEGTLKEVIQDISKITGREVSKEKEEKIINTILSNNVPKNIDKYFDNEN